MNLWAIFVAFILFFACVPYFRSIKMLRESRRKFLLTRYQFARIERLNWLEDHRFDLDFYDPAYQRLWDKEIGAEIAYLLFTGDIAYSASWDDYKSDEIAHKHDAEE